MDGDPAVEPELDTFSLYLPLPYRVAFILVLGISSPTVRCWTGDVLLTVSQGSGLGGSIFITSLF